MGILGPLSRRVAASGHVVGVDNDSIQIEAARAYVAEMELLSPKCGVEPAEERDSYRIRAEWRRLQRRTADI